MVLGSTSGFTRSTATARMKRRGFMMGGNWAELTPDLLILIAERTHSFEDRVAFLGVCRSWRCIKHNLNAHSSASSSAQIPWLMHSSQDNDFRGFASLKKGGMVRRVELPEAKGRRCITTSLGWLITIAENQDYEMELLHPFSRLCIPLPSLRNRKFWGTSDRFLTGWTSIHRAALSASPSKTDDYVLMIILGLHHFPAFWKPGNNVWTVIEQPRHPNGPACVDVIYFKDDFYAVNNKGDLLLCDLNSRTAQIVRHVSVNKPTIKGPVQAYVLECDGELLVVHVALHTLANGRSDTFFANRTSDSYYNERDVCFRIFKFDSTNLNNWQDSNDLGGRSVFLGRDSVATMVAPSAAGTKPNCIYFTDGGVDSYVTVSPSGGKDMGFFCGSFRTQYKKYSPPVWFVPSFL